MADCDRLLEVHFRHSALSIRDRLLDCELLRRWRFPDFHVVFCTYAPLLFASPPLRLFACLSVCDFVAGFQRKQYRELSRSFGALSAITLDRVIASESAFSIFCEQMVRYPFRFPR